MSIEFRGFGPDELRVPCYAQLNLLAHAQLEELDIGSQCGGHGICGGDRVRVAAADGLLSPATEAEREHLSPTELAEGWRLACQCFPDRDGIEIALDRR
jgi:2Fe-2S ferredoxin